MVIVGCDPSISKTGLVVRTEDGRYVSSLIKPPANSKDPARLYWIAATVVQSCLLQPEDDVLLVIEHPTPRRQLDVNYPLFWRLREEFAWHYQVSVLPVWPSQLNKFAAGDGKVSEIGAAVVRQWGDCLPGEANPDVLDALALCKFGELYRVASSGYIVDPTSFHRGTKSQIEVVRFDGTGTKKRERVAVDDRSTFKICEGGE